MVPRFPPIFYSNFYSFSWRWQSGWLWTSQFWISWQQQRQQQQQRDDVDVSNIDNDTEQEEDSLIAF